MSTIQGLQNILERAKKVSARIAYPEAQEERILLTARAAKDQGICVPVLVGSRSAVQELAEEREIDISDIEIFDSSDEAFVDELIKQYRPIRPLFSEKALKRKAEEPMYVALMMQMVGMVDGVVSGFYYPTAEVSMAARAMVGLVEGRTSVTGLSIMDVPGYKGSEGSMIVLSDVAYTVNPTAEELADNAILVCDSVRAILGWEPRCAMLSYSTCGSAKSEYVNKVADAVKIANQKRPDLDIDGEFQLDSAIVPEVAAKKVKRESRVAGRANVLMVPSLEVGNILVKSLQRFAGAEGIPSVTLGMVKPVCDCSRGATVDELLYSTGITVLQTNGNLS